MIKTRIAVPGMLFIILCFISGCNQEDQIYLVYNVDTPVLSYGANRLTAHLESTELKVHKTRRVRQSGQHVFILTEVSHSELLPEADLSEYFRNIDPEGYHLFRRSDSVFVLGKNGTGCLYGLMDLMEQIGPSCNFENIKDRKINPAFGFRAIKFNLPWAPYRPGPATDLHKETCRDLDFWEAFLDMMVDNRFNALSLWSAHLFPYMIRAENYPEATQFNEQELNEWQTFWRTLFKMARDRGIETYLVNWNIVVPEEFATTYNAKVHDDRSNLVKKYTRESVTQLINEYENLTGLGVTLADWMGNWGQDKMTPVEREEWIEDTFVEGMKNANRKIKFIHRAVLAGDPGEMRRVIDHADLPDKTIVEVKFNWSHAHSTPNLSLTHSNDEGTIMRGFWDPEPENYFIAWMMRNEDFFVLRWGNPDLMREHIRINHRPYVDGYFVGSEGYIPASDYSYMENHTHKTWDYAFQKQWMFYHLWGRLLYDPDVTNETLAIDINHRYPEVSGTKMLKAYSVASSVPMHLASFYKSTWDFTLYSEGFLAPWTTGYDDGISPFISLEELIRHETLDGRYLSIGDFCESQAKQQFIEEELLTPLELADQISSDCSEAMHLITDLRIKSRESAKNPNGESIINPTLESELDDLETWCHLGFYFADKLRGGVALKMYRLTGNNSEKKGAIRHLELCVTHWENVIRMTIGRYRPMPYVSMGHHEQKWPDFTSFHWNDFLDEVGADLEYAIRSGTR